MQKLIITITLFMFFISTGMSAEKAAPVKATVMNGWVMNIDVKAASFTFKPEGGKTLTIVTTASRLKWLKKGDFIRVVFNKQKDGSNLLSSYRKDPSITPKRK